jgi:transposase-like protein
MTQHRRHLSPEQKVALLRQHLVEKVPISEVCE